MKRARRLPLNPAQLKFLRHHRLRVAEAYYVLRPWPTAVRLLDRISHGAILDGSAIAAVSDPELAPELHLPVFGQRLGFCVLMRAVLVADGWQAEIDPNPLEAMRALAWAQKHEGGRDGARAALLEHARGRAAPPYRR